MPLLVVCLVPAAPVLLRRLTGSLVPEVEGVRAAVGQALAGLTDLDRVVVVSEDDAGTLAGFGAAAPGAPSAPSASEPAVPAGAVPPGASWPGELADELLDGAFDGVRPPAREHRTWAQVGPDLLAELDAARDRVGLLLLADGSRTRGPRAPGGQDARGDAVDAELVQALQQGRAADTPDAATVGATAVEAVRLLAAAPGGPTVLLHDEAPLGVCYLVAVRRRVGA